MGQIPLRPVDLRCGPDQGLRGILLGEGVAGECKGYCSTDEEVFPHIVPLSDESLIQARPSAVRCQALLVVIVVCSFRVVAG